MANGARKVAVIGAGNVGATCAFVLAERKVGEVVLLDIYEGFAKGKALDMSQGGRILNYDGFVSGTKDYGDISGSDRLRLARGTQDACAEARRSPGFDQLCRSARPLPECTASADIGIGGDQY